MQHTAIYSYTSLYTIHPLHHPSGVNPPVSPSGPALVPVLPRADRAVRTVSPAACTHVKCAVRMCHDMPSNRCTSMFVKALLGCSQRPCGQAGRLETPTLKDGQPLTRRADLRMMRPRPCHWHGHSTRACHCQSSGSTVQARSTCVDAFVVHSSPLGADMVWKSRNSSADALFTQGLLALIQPTICCVRSQSERDFATDFSEGVG